MEEGQESRRSRLSSEHASGEQEEESSSDDDASTPLAVVPVAPPERKTLPNTSADRLLAKTGRTTLSRAQIAHHVGVKTHLSPDTNTDPNSYTTMDRMNIINRYIAQSPANPTRVRNIAFAADSDDNEIVRDVQEIIREKVSKVERRPIPEHVNPTQEYDEQRVRAQLQKRQTLADELLKVKMEKLGHAIEPVPMLGVYKLRTPDENKKLLKAILATKARQMQLAGLTRKRSTFTCSTLNMSVVIGKTTKEDPISLDWPQLAKVLPA
eukprot:c13767_g1_i3.p1 GENE.c13767_g1_i3~~c13767_g1_i3.p1  ORF type:complete len:267 (+),score=46.66 c13767_g1_i3:50-850(+)